MTQRPKGQLLDQTVSIDRSSYEPAYAQLGNILRQSMASGVLRPGDQLPSEAQLCERYGLSPMRPSASLYSTTENILFLTPPVRS